MVFKTTVDPEKPFLINFIAFEEVYFRYSKNWGFLDERNYDIIRRYFGIHCSMMNLSQLGKLYDLSRERVRQIKGRNLARLHDTLSGASQEKPLRKCPPELVMQYQTFMAEVLQDHTIILRSSLLAMSPEEGDRLIPHLDLLMEILGYEFTSYRGFELYYNAAVLNGGTLADLMSAVYFIMRQEVYPISASVLIDKVRKDFSDVSPGDSVILDILDMIPDFETVTVDGRPGYQVRFDKLNSVEFMGLRVLRNHGRSMYYKDIAHEINRQLANAGHKKSVVLESLQVQLCSSDHVEAISRTGRWALVEWEEETASLKCLLERTLRAAGKAMTADDIYDAVKTIRAYVIRNSVLSLLNKYKDVFVCLKSGEFALVEWGIDSTQIRPSRPKHALVDDAAVMNAIIMIVQRHNKHVFTRAWLREQLKAEGYQFSDGVFYSRIINYPVLEVLPDSRSEIRLKVNADAAMVDNALSGKEMLTSRIGRRIEEILDGQDGEARLVDIVRQVALETGCARATVYKSVADKGFKKCVVQGKTVIMAKTAQNI